MARTTEELLAQHLSGTEAAAAALVSRFRPIAAAEAYRASGDPDLAEDAAQEALIRALANARQLQKPERFGEWLGTIARNEALGRLRRRKDVLVDADTGEPGPEFAAPEPTLPGADEASSGSDATRLAREAISRLPGRLRQVLELRYFHGCSYEEIAREVGIPVTTATSRLQRARDLFRDWYDELDTCEFSQEHLEGFLAGRLPYEDAWEVHNHVFLCDHCLRRMLELSAVRAEVLIRRVNHWEGAIDDVRVGLPWESPRLEARLNRFAETHPRRALPWVLLASFSSWATGVAGPGEWEFYDIAARVDPDSLPGLYARRKLALRAGDHEMARRLEDLSADRHWGGNHVGALCDRIEAAQHAARLGDVPRVRRLLGDAVGQLRRGRYDNARVANAQRGGGELVDELESLALHHESQVTYRLWLLVGSMYGEACEQYRRLARLTWQERPLCLQVTLREVWRRLNRGETQRATQAVRAGFASLPLRPPLCWWSHGLGWAIGRELGRHLPEAEAAGYARDYLMWMPAAERHDYLRRLLDDAPALRPELQAVLKKAGRSGQELARKCARP